MIRTLRRRHRRWVAVLGFVVVPLFVAGLFARKVDDTPPVRHEDPFAARIDADAWDENWQGAALGTRLVWGPPAGEQPAEQALYWAIVELRPLVAADPLVYHHAGVVRVGAGLPGGARFLGVFRSGDTFTAFAPPATRAGGTLFVLSLARGEVVATYEVTP